MIDKIENPMADAKVSWLAADEGGRKSGPPTAPVYAATAVFAEGRDTDGQPEWASTAGQLSILLEKVDDPDDEEALHKVDFLARDLAAPFLYPTAQILVMEGPRIVARAEIRNVHQGRAS